MQTSPAAPTRRQRLAALAAAVALVTAGCGSTVQTDDTAAAGAVYADGSLAQPGGTSGSLDQPGAVSGVPDPTGGTGLPGDTGGAGGGTGDGGTGGTGGTGNGGGGTENPSDPGNGNGGGGDGGVESGTGKLKVGLLYLDGADDAASALGISGLSTGDAKAQSTAIVKYLNDKGGVKGRPIDLKLAPVKANDMANNRTSALEAACSKLTQDDKVSFVVSYLALLPGTMACFAKAGVGVIDDATGLTDEVMAQNAGYLSSPGDIAPGRLMQVLVDALWKTGWLTKSSRVGAFSYDDAQSQAIVNGALKKALKSRGLDLVEYQKISNNANGVAQASGSVLRYRTSNIDRIIPVGANPLFLMLGASTQGYRPQYALYSTFGPGALLESAAPKDQLKGAAGIGWSPYLDIGRGTKPGPVSTNETVCFQLMSSAGQASTAATTKALQLQLCNAFFFLAHAADKVGGTPADLIARSRGAVKASFLPADTFKIDVSNRVDGVAAYRDYAYVDSCSCFQYGATRATG